MWWWMQHLIIETYTALACWQYIHSLNSIKQFDIVLFFFTAVAYIHTCECWARVLIWLWDYSQTVLFASACLPACQPFSQPCHTNLITCSFSILTLKFLSSSSSFSFLVSTVLFIKIVIRCTLWFNRIVNRLERIAYTILSGWCVCDDDGSYVFQFISKSFSIEDNIYLRISCMVHQICLNSK